MPNIRRTAKGHLIDFDHLRIKEQLAAQPTTTVIQAREDFIERKIHRRARKNYPKAGPVVAPISVEPKLPGTETDLVDATIPASQPIVQEQTATAIETKKTKQIARPKK